MRYGPQDMTEMMGIGSYVGEVRRGPDGQVYQWVEGVDGLGNLYGFWDTVKSIAKKAVPLATKFIPGLGPIIGAVKPFCQALPQLEPVMQQAPGIQPVYKLGTKICQVLGKVGIAGAEGGIMEAPDGQLYEVVENIGEPPVQPRPLQPQPRPMRRPVWISIPAVIRARGLRGMRRPIVTAAAPGAQPAMVAPATPGVRPAAVTPVSPVRRFR